MQPTFVLFQAVLGASCHRSQLSGGGLRKPPALRSCSAACPRSSGTVGTRADGPRRARRLLQFLLPPRSSRTRAGSVWEQLHASRACYRSRSCGSVLRIWCQPHAPGGVGTYGRHAACLQWHSVHVVAKPVPRSISCAVSAGRRTGMLSRCAEFLLIHCNVLPCSVACPDVCSVPFLACVPYCENSCYKNPACR